MKTILKLSSIIILLLVVSCGSDDDTSCTEQTWYQDADADGFGNANVTQSACTQPTGYVSDNTDFDDNNASSFPNATEICDGIDNDGDGQVDGLATSNCGAGEVCENGSCVQATTYYADQDQDGYGDASNSILAGSTAPTGYVLDNTDCNDSDVSMSPGAQENATDGIDNDCDGEIDECDSNSVTECDCTDGVDNDNDGDVDCDDSDCTGMTGC